MKYKDKLSINFVNRITSVLNFSEKELLVKPIRRNGLSNAFAWDLNYILDSKHRLIVTLMSSVVEFSIVETYFGEVTDILFSDRIEFSTFELFVNKTYKERKRWQML